MENSDAMRLAAAIVLQAVEDWKGLCDGETATSTMNFAELEEFFNTDLDTFLIGTNIRAKDVKRKMRKLRAKAKLYGG